MPSDLFDEPAITVREKKDDPPATTFDRDRLWNLSNHDFLIEVADFLSNEELAALGPVGRDSILAAIEAKQSVKAEAIGHTVTIRLNVVGKSAGAGEGLDK